MFSFKIKKVLLPLLLVSSSFCSAGGPVFTPGEELPNGMKTEVKDFGMSNYLNDKKLQANINKMMSAANKTPSTVQVGGYTYSSIDAMSYLGKLGFDIGPKDDLLFFITWDMPEKLIKTIMEDAVSVGGTVIVKGVPPEIKNMNEYLKKTVMKYIRDDGLNPVVQMDPTLFDSFKIELAPAVVYVKNIKNVCQSKIDESVTFKGTDLKISQCVPEPVDSYIKISGNVTLKYALEQFKEKGFNTQKYLDLQQEFIKTGGNNVRELAKQQAEMFGEYSDGVVTPYNFETGFFKDQ